MYLARKETGSRQSQYVLRESYRSGGILYSRELANWAAIPASSLSTAASPRFISMRIFFVGSVEQGVTAPYGEMEELLFPFIDPYIKNRLQPFRNRHKYRNWQRADKTLLQRALTETHVVDRRRIHFLRMGRTTAETVEKTAALYTVLLDKSRDEIEQMILEQEQTLLPREQQSYLFTIFDLQRFFQESYARSIPQALNRERLDSLFVEEICRLASDRNFWQGFPQTDRLPYSLVRYLIMYFDSTPEEPTSWSNFGRSQRARRFHRSSYSDRERMSRTQAFAIFGLTGEQLAVMRKKDLARIYRQKAHELHPDKGGDTEQFIRLTAAYEELLPSLP